MGNVRMRAEQINYGASNVKVALDDLDPKDLIALSARMDTIEAWKATVKAEEKTGASVEFTNALALPAVSVSAEIVASQDLHGYDNPWVGGAGFNKLDSTAMEKGGINEDGTERTDTTGNYWRSDYIPLATNTYYIKLPDGFTPQTGNANYYYYDSSKAFISKESNKASIPTAAPATCAYIRVTFYLTVAQTTFPEHACLNISDATKNGTYEPYANICPISGFSTVTITNVDAESQTATVTVSLGQTVYGGTLDLSSGELTITHGFITLDGTQEIIIANWRPKANSIGWLYRYNLTNAKVLSGDEVGDIISNSLTANTYNQLYDFDVTGITSYTDTSYGLVVRVADTSLTTSALINAYLASNPIQVCYELATPTTTTLTAEQLALVKGYNHISANSGDITVKAYTGAPWGGDE